MIQGFGRYLHLASLRRAVRRNSLISLICFGWKKESKPKRKIQRNPTMVQRMRMQHNGAEKKIQCYFTNRLILLIFICRLICTYSAFFLLHPPASTMVRRQPRLFFRFLLTFLSQVQRLTYRRRHSYNTRSNKTRVVRTPGNRLTLHYIKKKAKGPRCGDCGSVLAGVRFSCSLSRRPFIFLKYSFT